MKVSYKYSKVKIFQQRFDVKCLLPKLIDLVCYFASGN